MGTATGAERGLLNIPDLFQVFHQVIMRRAMNERSEADAIETHSYRETSARSNEETGITMRANTANSITYFLQTTRHSLGGRRKWRKFEKQRKRSWAISKREQTTSKRKTYSWERRVQQKPGFAEGS